MNKLQRAYLAGLIDGEGYIGLLKVKKGNKKVFSSSRDYLYCPVFKLCMTYKELVEHYYNSYGGCFETRKMSDKNPNWKDSYTWTVRNLGCLDLLKEVYPYLKTKRKEVEILIKFSKLNNGAGSKISDTNWEQRDTLYSEIRALHYRGSGTVRD